MPLNTNMAKKKAVKKAIKEVGVPPKGTGHAPKVIAIELLPADFGREDLNLMAAKINEIIEKYG